MRSKNPALREETFEKSIYNNTKTNAGVMSLQGTAVRALVLVAIVLLGAVVTWTQTMPALLSADIAKTPDIESVSIPSNVWTYMLVGVFGGFILALIIIFNQSSAPMLSPIYAFLEGIAIGGVSAAFEYHFPNIVMQAVALTFGVFISMLLIYIFKIIKPTRNFLMGIVSATGGICILYLVDLALNLFGFRFPFIHESGWMGILFSLFVVTIAALNLVIDFDFIEKGVKEKAPKYMEWYSAFGLLVTLVWLYLEILRLLAKARSGSKN